MTLNQLLYFETAAKLQHFNQAADELNISEPSLSRSISALEKEFGIPLFEKQGRNVVLTKPGMVFFEYASKILDDVRIAEDKMRELSSDGGHIDIAYVAPLARYFIPKTVRAFLKQPGSKNVIFNFYQDITSRNVEGLRNGSYDLIFGSMTQEASDIEFVPVAQQNMVIILPETHALAAKEHIDLSIFNQYPVLCYDKASGLGKYSTAFFEKHGLHPDIICESPDENGIASLVAEGFGIAIVADVDDIHRPGIAIKALPNQEEFPHTVYMAFLKGKYQLPAVKRLIKFVKEYHSESI